MASTFRGDPYEVLGATRQAGPKQLKTALRRLAKLHHPDVSADPNAAVRMARINSAYDLLSDPVLRAAWDLTHPIHGADSAGRRAPKGATSKSNAPPTGPRSGSNKSAGKADHGREGSARKRPPTLDEAVAYTMQFGKFRGRTLGYIEAVEPGYLDWILRSISDRPDLVRHVRVVAADRGTSSARPSTAASGSSRSSDRAGQTAAGRSDSKSASGAADQTTKTRAAQAQAGAAAMTSIEEIVGGLLSYLFAIPLLYAILIFGGTLLIDGRVSLRDATGAIAQPVLTIAGLAIVVGDAATFWYFKLRHRRRA